MAEQAAAAQSTTSAAAEGQAAPAATEKTEVVAAAPAKTESAKTEVTTKGGAETEVSTKVDAEKPKPAETTAEPEKLTLKLSKDSLLDSAYLAKIEAEAKAEGLSGDQAQARLVRDENLRKSFVDQQVETFKKQTEDWRAACESDPEIGGKAYKENIEAAHRALNRYAPDAFKKELDRTGFGNHPDLVRTFMRVGKAMAEDKLVTEGKAGTSQKSKKSTTEKLYPNMKHE